MDPTEATGGAPRASGACGKFWVWLYTYDQEWRLVQVRALSRDESQRWRRRLSSASPRARERCRGGQWPASWQIATYSYDLPPSSC